VTSPPRIEITDNAQSQIVAASVWWKENRPAAPDAVFEELERILHLLALQPSLGARAKQATLSGVRRVLLSRIHYYVYYRVTDEALQVLAFWHASRGQGPGL
jgi:plasmid stabilization system protein ParE